MRNKNGLQTGQNDHPDTSPAADGKGRRGAAASGLIDSDLNGSGAGGHHPNGHGLNGANLNGHSLNGSIANRAEPDPALDAAEPAPERRYAQIVGWGSYVPEKVITNHDLEQIVDTTDEWIRERTGIEQRHIVVDPLETTATLGVQAARKALAVADVPASKVDLIVCATCTPEHSFPATASIIQDSLGATNAGAYDLSAACSGFVYGMAMARSQILAGDAEYVLVIGSETFSRIVDWTDRTTCVLFGDGAGAILVAASDVPGGIMASDLGSDGSGAGALGVPAGGSAMPATMETVSSGSHYVQMDGKAVFRFATRVMAKATRKVLDKAGLTTDDVDMVFPHQANMRIISNSVQRQLKIPEDKIYVNLQKYGNTSTASIPLALCDAIEEKKVSPGDNLVFVGFGGGLTWAACSVKWTVPTDAQATNWWKTNRREAGYIAARARSMWKKAVRQVYGALPNDPRDRRGKPIGKNPTTKATNTDSNKE